MPQVFLLLLLSFFTLSLAQLCHLYWIRHWFPDPKAVALHCAVHRLLKPRSPRDCPTCRLSCTLSSGVGSAPLPVRPWREVKSRRGAPKRVNTEGLPVPSESAPPPAVEQQETRELVMAMLCSKMAKLATCRKNKVGNSPSSSLLLSFCKGQESWELNA